MQISHACRIAAVTCEERPRANVGGKKEKKDCSINASCIELPSSFRVSVGDIYRLFMPSVSSKINLIRSSENTGQSPSQIISSAPCWWTAVMEQIRPLLLFQVRPEENGNRSIGAHFTQLWGALHTYHIWLITTCIAYICSLFSSCTKQELSLTTSGRCRLLSSIQLQVSIEENTICTNSTVQPSMS